MSEVDWTAFNKYSEDTIECRCGAVYRSHAKAKLLETGFTVITRKPCPACGKDRGHVRSARTDPETWTS
jgi:hypothetical protein